MEFNCIFNMNSNYQVSKLEVHKAVNINISVLRVMTPHNLYGCYPRFGGSFVLHLRTLKLEIGFFSETMRTSFEITRHNVRITAYFSRKILFNDYQLSTEVDPNAKFSRVKS